MCEWAQPASMMIQVEPSMLHNGLAVDQWFVKSARYTRVDSVEKGISGVDGFGLLV